MPEREPVPVAAPVLVPGSDIDWFPPPFGVNVMPPVVPVPKTNPVVDALAVNELKPTAKVRTDKPTNSFRMCPPYPSDLSLRNSKPTLLRMFSRPVVLERNWNSRCVGSTAEIQGNTCPVAETLDHGRINLYRGRPAQYFYGND